MKNKLIFIILSFVVLNIIVGCGSARMSSITFNNDGKMIGKKEIRYIVIGSRKSKKIDIDIENGTAKIGGHAANSGSLTKILSDIAKLSAGAVGGVVVSK